MTRCRPAPIGSPAPAGLIDAPLSATWERVQADHRRGASRERDFHEAAHARYRALMSEIPADLTFDSGDMTAAKIAMSI
jgi:hypothetical protein